MNIKEYFNNKVILITGGSSGIGKALARLLAGYGASVVLLARDPEKLEKAIREIKESARHDDPTVEGISLDVTDAERVTEVVEQIILKHGRMDVLINSAGKGPSGYATSLGLDDYRKIMDLNFFGTLNMIKAVLPKMIAQKSGHITNIGSNLSLFGVFGFSTYVASKFALAGFSEVLRAEMKPHGIRVSLLITGYVDTPMYRKYLPLEPPETRSLTRMGAVRPAERVAAITARGMAAGKYLIYTDFEAWFLPWLSRIFPGTANRFMDYKIKKAWTSP